MSKLVAISAAVFKGRFPVLAVVLQNNKDAGLGVRSCPVRQPVTKGARKSIIPPTVNRNTGSPLRKYTPDPVVNYRYDGLS